MNINHVFTKDGSTSINDDYVFPFGKHKGLKLADVAIDHPCYVLWCLENIDWFKLPKDQREAIEMDCREEQAYMEACYPDDWGDK